MRKKGSLDQISKQGEKAREVLSNGTISLKINGFSMKKKKKCLSLQIP